LKRRNIMTRRIFCKVLLVIVAFFGLLVLSGVLSAQGNSDWAFEHVKDVQERNATRLMAMDGIEGTAIGYNQNDRLAIKVFTAGPGVRGIPQTLDGVPVQVVVTGKFYALPKGGNPDKPNKKPPNNDVDPTSRFDRPVPIGVSTGNEGENSAGTIGCRVTDGTNVYALSNNHVYALENEATSGSDVLQPGRYDGGVAGIEPDGDTIGILDDYQEIFFGGPDNTIDAAIALCSKETLGNATPADGYGIPASVTQAATLGMSVQKYGRTTGLTKGSITGINAIVNVGYSSGTARFVEQILITGTRGKFSNAGDSGSLIVTQSDNKPVGLLFAGGANITIANPIDTVITELGVSIDDSTE
jgi:hypothetical protein